MVAGDGYDKPWTLLWVAAALAAAHLVAALALKARLWARGGALPPAPRTAPFRIARLWFAEAVAQRHLLRISPLRWAAHLAIVWGFTGLALLSALHVVAALGPADGLRASLAGGGRAAAKLWGNAWGLVLLAGLTLALVRRLARRGGAPDDDPREADLPLVIFLFALTLSGFVLEGLRHALAGAAPATAAALRPWLTALWTAHGLGGVALVGWLPRSTLLHALLAPLVIALNARNEHPRKDLSWAPPPGSRAAGSPRA